MFNIDCMILGTCDPQRLAWLERSLDFMDSQGFPFKNRHLVIDQLDDRRFPQSLNEKLLNRGWKVHMFSVKSRATCMLRVLDQIESEAVFYNEDDVLVKLPAFGHVEKTFDLVLEGRQCGMLSMTLGGSDHDFPKQKFGDLKDIKKNVVLDFKDYLVFKRLEEKRSQWFVEFPALFCRTRLLKSILEPGFDNGGLESLMTAKYFAEEKEKEFYKVSLCKKNVFEVVKWYENNFSYEMLETAKMIRLLDSKQGGAQFNLDLVPEL